MGKIQINFTAPSPAPSNGYRVRYKKSTDSNYITVAPNPTASPVVISGVENGVTYNVTIESDCGNENYSVVTSATAAPAKTFVSCPASLSGSEAGSAYYTYPAYYLDVFNPSITSLSFNYNANDRPNRYNIYDENNNLILSTGWVGTANYSGPWGASLNVAASGTFVVPRDPGSTYYKIVVEAGPGAPVSPISDSWNLSVICTV